MPWLPAALPLPNMRGLNQSMPSAKAATGPAMMAVQLTPAVCW